MQGYMGDLYTGILYLLQKLFCKVQSCGRSGCASLVFRVYRLVAVLVLQLVCDVRRQRHLSELIQNLLKNPFVMELDQAVALLHNVNDLAGQKSLTKIDSGSDLAFFSRFDQGLPDIVFLSLEQKNLDLCLSAFLTPYSLAGITFVLLMTRQSPGLR